MANRRRASGVGSQAPMVAGEHAGVFKNSSWYRRTAAAGDVRGRATVKKSDGVFLDHWHSDISGLRIDGDVSGPDFELSAQPRGLLGESYSKRGTSNCGRWRDFGAGTVRDAGVLQEPRGDPGGVEYRWLVQHRRYRLPGRGWLFVYY